jgi:hypothetical protein
MDQSTPEQTNNKAASTKPKRPLTAFNLFYRFKRQAILKSSTADSTNGNNDDEAAYARGIIELMPGLEYEWYTPLEYSDMQYMTEDQVKATRRATIRNVLEANLTASKDSKKRKGTSGALSFVEMNKLMCAAWKETDAYAKQVFTELAEEGKALHRVKMEEWAKANPEEANKKKGTKKSALGRRKSSEDLNEKPTKRASTPVQTSYESTAAPVSPNGSIETAVMNQPQHIPPMPQFERQDSSYIFGRSVSEEYSVPIKKRDVSALAMETASLMMDESGLGILEFMLNTGSSSSVDDENDVGLAVEEEPVATAPQSPSPSSSRVSIDDVMQLLRASKKQSAATESGLASSHPSSEDFMKLLNGNSEDDKAADEIVAAMVSPETSPRHEFDMDEAVYAPPPPPFESADNYEQDVDMMFGNFHEVKTTPKEEKKPRPSNGDFMQLFGQMDLFQKCATRVC